MDKIFILIIIGLIFFMLNNKTKERFPKPDPRDLEKVVEKNISDIGEINDRIDKIVSWIKALKKQDQDENEEYHGHKEMPKIDF